MASVVVLPRDRIDALPGLGDRLDHQGVLPGVLGGVP